MIYSYPDREIDAYMLRDQLAELDIGLVDVQRSVHDDVMMLDIICDELGDDDRARLDAAIAAYDPAQVSAAEQAAERDAAAHEAKHQAMLAAVAELNAASDEQPVTVRQLRQIVEWLGDIGVLGDIEHARWKACERAGVSMIDGHMVRGVAYRENEVNGDVDFFFASEGVYFSPDADLYSPSVQHKVIPAADFTPDESAV